MSELIDGDDGLVAEEVGSWAKKKHQYLCRYIDISRAVRAQWTRPGGAGATYIDPFCGTGRAKVRETGEWIDGGAVSAWKESRKGGAKFTKMYVGDSDTKRLESCVNRLRGLGAPVAEMEGPALNAIRQTVPDLKPSALHFVFLDPFSLGPLDFGIIETLSKLKRIDMLIHLSQMDLQRNLTSYATSDNSPFDSFVPGWRENISTNQGQESFRQAILQLWRDKVTDLGVEPSVEMRLISGSKKQPLYWLLLAAKHELALEFWGVASNIDGQGSLF